MPFENLNPWVMKQLKKRESRRPAPEEKPVKMDVGDVEQIEVSSEKVSEIRKADMDVKEEMAAMKMEEKEMKVEAPVKEVKVESPVCLEEITKENVTKLKSVNESTMTNLFEDETYEGAITLKEHGRLAYLDEIPVGYVITKLYENRKLLVTSIGVPFPHRKSGIGSMLMKYVENLAEQLDQVKKLWLYIRPTNTKAIRFFESHGMKKTQRLRTYFSGESREAYRMSKRIRK